MSTFVLRGPGLPVSRFKLVQDVFAGFGGALFQALRFLGGVFVEADEVRRNAERRYPYLRA